MHPRPERPSLDLVLGRSDRGTGQVGFNAVERARTPPSRLVRLTGDSHLLAIGPTGSGKGRSLIVPNLLRCPRNAIVIDPKGEAYAVTRRAREAMGQRVVLLDPFGVTGDPTATLDPFDVFDLPGAHLDTEAEMLATVLCDEHRSTNDPYWADTGTALAAAVVAHVASRKPDPKHPRTLAAIADLFFEDDVDYAIALLLDGKEVQSPLARRNFAAYLQIPTDKTRPCVLSSARCMVQFLANAHVARVLERGEFSLRSIVDDEPLTVFVVFPPDKIESHRPLLRVWVHALLLAVMRRPVLPEHPTLFLVDEAAQLGSLPMLKTALTFLRGCGGMQVWTFWQDLAQIKNLYPRDYETILANSGVLQALGIPNPLVAQSLHALFGVSADTLLALSKDRTALWRVGSGFEVLRKLDYLKDADCRGRYAPNPRFARRPADDERSAH